MTPSKFIKDTLVTLAVYEVNEISKVWLIVFQIFTVKSFEELAKYLGVALA
jgi:hypothetical protein